MVPRYREDVFLGLVRGEYILLGKEMSLRVLVDGDETVDLAGKRALPEGTRRALGVVMILVINLAGTAAIVRIWRRVD